MYAYTTLPRLAPRRPLAALAALTLALLVAAVTLALTAPAQAEDRAGDPLGGVPLLEDVRFEGADAEFIAPQDPAALRRLLSAPGRTPGEQRELERALDQVYEELA